MHLFSSPKVIFLSLVLIVVTSFILHDDFQSGYNFDNRSKASSNTLNSTKDIKLRTQGNTLNVCPDASGGCTYVGGEGLQKAVDDAKDGDIISVSGTLTNRNPSVDKQIKYEKCMVNLRGKNITLKGPAKLFGENGSYKSPDWDMVIGICSEGGNFTIENIQVMQTLRQAFYFQRSKAVLKNVSTNDIDNINAEFIGGSVSISNSIFGGGATVVARGGTNIRLINNTISTGGAGYSIDLCSDGLPTVYAVNNVIKLFQAGYEREDPDPNGTGFAIKCPEKIAQNPNSKIAYNMVWKGAGDENGSYGCSGGEYCNGVSFANPKIINTTIYGDIGWSYAINWDLDPASPGNTAGDGGVKIGATGNACSASNSHACQTLNSPLPETVAPTNPPPGSGGGENGGGEGHIPPTVTGMYPEPSFAWPTAVPENGQSPTTPPNGGGGNNNPTAPPNTGGGGNNPNGGNRNTGGGGTNPTISYYFPPTEPFNNQNGNNLNNSSPNNPPKRNASPGNIAGQPSIHNLQPSIKPTPKPFIDIDKTITNTRTNIISFIKKIEELSKQIMP